MRTVLGAVLIFLPTISPAQGALPGDSLPLRECKTPSLPVGPMGARGQVALTLDKDGHPDTASVRVLAAAPVSEGGFRSAVSRQFTGCRWNVPKRFTPGTPVTVAVRFKGILVEVDAAVVDSVLAEGLTPRPVLLPTSQFPLPIGYRGLEELPGLGDACKPSGVGSPPSGPFRSRAEADAAFDRWAEQNSGDVSMVFEIGPDGLVVGSSLVIESSTNPNVTNRIRDAVVRCRFAPARIGGIPVPAMYRFRLGNVMRRAEGP